MLGCSRRTAVLLGNRLDMLGTNNTIPFPGSHHVEDCVDNLIAVWDVDLGVPAEQRTNALAFHNLTHQDLEAMPFRYLELLEVGR